MDYAFRTRGKITLKEKKKKGKSFRITSNSPHPPQDNALNYKDIYPLLSFWFLNVLPN